MEKKDYLRPDLAILEMEVGSLMSVSDGGNRVDIDPNPGMGNGWEEAASKPHYSVWDLDEDE